ncbi:MAG: response regulator [Chloroflexi bacterium]|nr:response regulator [Chloroflexota bacterium]
MSNSNDLTGSIDPGERVNILLVDDQSENLLALEAALGSLGENLVKALSGREALRRVLADDYAVVLLDVRMPDLDGFETAAIMRERDRTRYTPIIFLTAISKTEVHMATGYSLGAVDYIFKPINPDVLRSKVAVFADLFRKTRQVERLNARLQQRTSDLETANRDLESFSYSVSHDLRAPLRAISGFAEIITRRHSANLNEEGRHYVNNVVEACAHMNRLIDDLLAYARLGRQALRYEAVSLTAVLSQIREGCNGRLSDLGAKLSIAPDLPTVKGDRTLLHQTFSNLVDNALTYRRPEVPPQIDVTWEGDLDWCTIRVRDNGIGIAKEHQEKIFQVFQRLHGTDKYQGTGIGLAIVSKSVAMMGGQIRVESAVGEGSTFCVTLPREL